MVADTWSHTRSHTWSHAAVTLQDVAFSRGERALVRGLSVALTGGDAVALVGPNGAGKTSLLRILAGLAEPDDGALTMTADGAQDDLPRGALVHLGGHQDGLKGQLTVRQNLAFWQRYYGDEEGRGTSGLSVDAALARLDIAHLVDLPAAVLSQGQKRRVALARLLVVPRPIWLLDEPTAALDTASTARFLALVDDHRSQGGIVIAATHSALALDRLVTLDLGAYPAHGGDEAAHGPAGLDAESYWLGETVAGPNVRAPNVGAPDVRARS